MEALVLDVDIEDQLVLKTGGKLQLTALMQKRIVELKRGARPLVEIDSTDLQEIVIQEILQDKIYLDTSHEARITGDLPSAGDMPDLDPSDL